MTDSESHPPKKEQYSSQQNQEATAVNHNTRTTTTTIHQLADELIGISLELLGGNGHFRYGPSTCKMFHRASKLIPHFKKRTSGESVTSSVSCAKEYFQDKGTAKKRLRFFWYNAAINGRVDVMEWARQQGYSDVWERTDSWRCSIGTRLCEKAAEYGQLKALQWLRENGCKWDKYTCSAAAKGGHLSILIWARENGCPWNEETCRGAAVRGHLSCLQWARENGCPWDRWTCQMAACGGNLSILQWLRENGCPWCEHTCFAAFRGGHLVVLQWAIENGCPWDEAAARDEYKFHSILDWAP